MKVIWLVLALGFFSAQAAFAQNLVGTWQGATGKQQRVLVVSKAPGGGLRGEFYTLGFDVHVNPVSTIAVRGQDVSFELDRVLPSFTGTLSADGKSIVGSWKDQGPAQPLTLERASGKDTWVIDTSPHKVLFVPVDTDVRLEVLDWGGIGPPMVFLAGLGNTAHVFDTLAPHFIDKHHVYGITRRGFGASSYPAPTDANYDANRLGDDVLAVIDFLKLKRPVVVGHSIAGEELSSIGTRHPEKVGGLIYLDAAFRYAFYGQTGDHYMGVDAAELRRLLEKTATIGFTHSVAQEIEATIERMMPALQQSIKLTEGLPDREPPPMKPQDYVAAAIVRNERKFGPENVPTLALLAVPHQCEPDCDSPGTKLSAIETAAQADAFESGTPSARIVRLPYANHYVWRTNEADVLSEMDAFLDGLDKQRKAGG